MTTKKIRAGIIGTSGISRMHAKGLQAAGDRFSLDAACDTNAPRLQEFGAEFQIPCLYADYRQLLNDPGIDAVLVLTPHHLHEPMGVEALRAGKHTLIEKPIARTIAEADSLIAAQKNSGRTLLIAHNQRYYPAAAKARELIRDGAIGLPHIAEASHHQNFNVPHGHWWRSKDAVGGGCVIASGVHRLDLLRWYLGDADEVFAFASHDADRLEGECNVTASIKFKSGALANFLCNWALTAAWQKTRYAESLSVFGKTGHLALPEYSEDKLLLKTPGADEREIAIERNAYPTMWNHFADCIQSGADPLTNATEAKKSLALVLGIYESIQSGRAVKL